MERAPFTHADYLAFAREALLSCPEARGEILALPEGAYLFGHNHLQFHIEYQGRLLINPGSCGAALDFDPSAAYTLLEYTGDDWLVTERRAAYDTEYVADKIRGSEFAIESPVWAGVIERMATTGKDYFGPLVRHVADTGRRNGHTKMPVPNDIWDIAIATWDPDDIYLDARL